MSTSSLFRLNLRRLILLLAIFGVVVTLVNVLLASYKVQKELLIENTLESNRVYSAKIAANIEDFLLAARQQIQYSAKLAANHIEDENWLDSEVQRLAQQTRSYNSIVIVNAKSRVLAASPETLQLKGKTIRAKGSDEALAVRKPIISQPFLSPKGKFIISISHPIFSDIGDYLGFVSGAIYLRQDSILKHLVDEHDYKDGSYLYVVDQEKRLLHHKSPERIGEIVPNNAAINAVITGQTGSLNLVNSKGIEMLAGYSPVLSTGWGIVVQRPKKEIMAALEGRMQAVLQYTLPVTLGTFFLIWLFARVISKPLWQMANNAKKVDLREARSGIVRIKAWYFEAAQLKESLLEGISLVQQQISRLHQDALTDPMTQLYNRRGMQKQITHCQGVCQQISVIALDIDHFKRINDSYGHDIGDRVIKTIAEVMRSSSREQDVICRSGGEEFVILQPNTSPETANQLAEQIRSRVESANLVGIKHNVTISCGIACWQKQSELSIEQTITLADEALYSAKRQGRNRVISTHTKK